MTPTDRPRQPTPPRRWHGLRRGHDPAPGSDSVIIGDEASYAWWAGRDELLQAPTRQPVDPSPQAFADTSSATAPGPAPEAGQPSATTPTATTRSAWDLDSLYEWATESQGGDVESGHGPEDASVAWMVLGLTADATWSEITRRHRTLVKRHHPDLHAGADELTRRRAEERMAEINAAFDELGDLYGVRRGA